MVVLPRAFVQQHQLDREVAEIEGILSPNVLRIRYELGEDWTGQPSVFFRVTLSDEASRQDQLLKVAKQVSSLIEQRIEPLEQWGVLPYFDFRSQSEQAQLRDPAWA